MRAFKTKRLDRWARKEGLSDAAMWNAAGEILEGEFEASLGRHLYKKRIARPGKGKSGGFRTIVAFKDIQDGNVYFLYGFAKSDRSNINSTEREALCVIAKTLVEATGDGLKRLLQDGALVEIEEAHHQ